MATESVPESLGSLFLRFLRFGLLAWGGPVAQIAMIKRELVEDERWIEPSRFNRLLAIYQVLPGPEAHKLCVHFGMMRRGRAGALVAGLRFMLPGLLLILLLAALYRTIDLRQPLVAAAFLGIQIGVIALIVRAVHRIADHALVRLAHVGRVASEFAERIAHLTGVERVLHPQLSSCPGHETWKRDFAGASGAFSIVLPPSTGELIDEALSQLQVFAIGASGGGTRSLVAPMSVEAERSVVPWLEGGTILRLSIGLEDEADLWSDIEQLFGTFAVDTQRSSGTR